MPDPITITLELEIPPDAIEEYLNAMTGDADDVLIVAERALRRRLGEEKSIGLYLRYAENIVRVMEEMTRELSKGFGPPRGH